MSATTVRTLRPRLHRLSPGVYQTLDRRFTITRVGAAWVVEEDRFERLRDAAISLIPRLGFVSRAGDAGTVYLLHFDRPFGHAQHYLGYTNAESVLDRIERHRAGGGSNLLKHVNAAGIGYELVRVWPGGRDVERRLKRWGGAAQHCPVCRPEVLKRKRESVGSRRRILRAAGT